jgi:DNA processing protein
LWYLGDPSTLEAAPDRCVAIVGTREASPYGERIAARLATAAVRAGLVVVSGLARGIDAAAHRAAMEAGGLTVAVMGPGVDVPYPAGHRTLQDLVQKNGVVVSESEPGTKAYRGCFPRRNRIIAALSQVTVVVEAPFKSGAINTATQALEMGRTVAAVPGPIDDARSGGTNLLVRDGAQVITCEADLLTLCGLSTIEAAVGAAESGADTNAGDWLSQADRVLLRSLTGHFTPVHEIAFQSGLSVRQVSDSLLRLEIAASIEAGNGGYRRIG